MSLYLKTLPQPSRIMKDVPLTEALTDSTYKVLLPSKFFNNTAFDVCQPLLSPKQKTLFHFNPRTGGSAAQERPAKRIKIESSDKATMEEVSKLVDPLFGPMDSAHPFTWHLLFQPVAIHFTCSHLVHASLSLRENLAKILVLSHLRHKVSLNSCAELCSNGDAGDCLMLVSKGSNAFLQGKEMCTAKFIQGRDAVNCNFETLIFALYSDSLS